MNRTEEIISLIPDDAKVLVVNNEPFTASLCASKKVEVYTSLVDIAQNYFDFAILYNFLDSLPQPEQVIGGLRRALKPSGTVYALVDTIKLPVDKLIKILDSVGCVYAYETGAGDALFTIKYKLDVKPKRYGLAIGIIATETVPTKWWEYMNTWAKRTPGGVFWNFIIVEGKYYDAARQEVVQKAYNMGVEWLFFLDSDVFPPSDCLHRLMSHNVPIVTGVYWMKSSPPQPVVYKVLGNGPIWEIDPTAGLVEIGGAGLGCTLINMSVFDNLESPYFKTNWSMVKDGRTIHSQIGEDHYFYLMAQKAGYKIYMDPTVLCDHYDVKNNKFFPEPEVIKKICGTKLRMLGDTHMTNRLAGSIDRAKKIIFFTQMGCQFNGNSINEKPIAGSETAVIQMAKQMAKRGHKVSVYCNCDAPGIYDNVSYFDASQFNPKEECDLFISSRCVDLFYERPKAIKTVLWCHDLPVGWAYANLKFVHSNIDLIMGVSEFHRNLIQTNFPMIPPEKIVATGNGVDLARFKFDVPKNRKKLLYATTPFRGLDVLLSVWPRIHSAVPDAELYIFSGMAIYGMQEPQQHLDMYERAKKLPGVHYSNSIRQDELAKECLSAGLYVYPSHFIETSCISVMENITAGTPVVSTNAGALPETVGDCGVLIDGDSQDPIYQQKFVDAVVKLLTNDSEYNKLVDNCKKRDFSWDRIGAQWNKSFFGNNNVNTPLFWNRKHLSQVIENDTSGDRKELWAKITKSILGCTSVLDYGCGLGYLAKAIKEQVIGCKVYGYDFSDYAMAQSGLQAMEGNGPFDVIVATNLIECLDNPDEWAEQIKLRLAPQGKIIISITEGLDTPEAYNQYSLDSFIEWLNKHFNNYKLEFQDRNIIAICEINQTI